MPRIAVCGNHRESYCTEAELAWTFEDLGHQVVRFQENETPTSCMVEICKQQAVDLFVYVHTHGWKSVGTLSLDQVIEQLRAGGTKTASFHLDRYWGLNGDNREHLVGRHAFWHTDVVFTADGGNQERFKSRGVNHVWLPPAVAKRHCFRGVYRQELAADVVFVGARNYHVEYPFRTQLIQWLERTYGRRFRRFNGDAGGTVRETRLNDIYASAKVVVGDSCFAGSPLYWSDRVPETLGRGGFLIHPLSAGLDIDGLVTYLAEDVSALKSRIEFYLEEDTLRLEMSATAMGIVEAHHTYHNRMTELLNVMGLSCL